MLWRRALGAFLLVGGVILLALFLGSLDTAKAQPPAPHPVAPGMDCLGCHGPGEARPIPASHVGWPVAQCANCHKSGPFPQVTPAPQGPDAECLACHGNTNLTWKLPGGETLRLTVDAKEVAGSVHGDKLTCLGCHKDIQGYPHRTIFAMTPRDYSLASYELCKGCHFDQYTKGLDSVHYKQLASGHKNAPVCTDCHGAHNVADPQTPRPRISLTCARCHEEISQDYLESIHGKALVEENNRDVPVCTDCHGVHNIHDPRTAQFRVETPEMCSDCHGNQAIMSKYGISNITLKTYLEDFHGVTINFYKKEGGTVWPRKAVCTDCHGVHDIQATDNPQSHVIKANLINTCQKCHPQATSNFPDAWLQHYEPSPDKWPIVYYARLFYNILIPLTVGGLLLHIGLDLAKTVTRRRGKGGQSPKEGGTPPETPPSAGGSGRLASGGSGVSPEIPPIAGGSGRLSAVGSGMSPENPIAGSNTGRRQAGGSGVSPENPNVGGDTGRRRAGGLGVSPIIPPLGVGGVPERSQP